MRALYSGDDGGWKNDLTNSLALSAGKKLTYTPTVTGNRRQFTIMCNVRLVSFGTIRYIFNAGVSTGSFNVYFDASDKLNIEGDPTATYGKWVSTKVFRDTEHFVLGIAYDSVARTISVTQNEEELEAATYTIPTANAQPEINMSGQTMRLNSYTGYANGAEGVVSDFVLLDGEVLTPQEMINYHTQNVPHGNGVNVTTKKFTTEGTQERWLGFRNNNPAYTDPILNNENQYIQGNTAGWRIQNSDIVPNIKFQV